MIIYQLNGVKIPNYRKSLVVEGVQYASSSNAFLSGAKGVTKVEVTMPEHNPETERLEQLDSGQYQVVPLTAEEIEQIAESKLNKTISCREFIARFQFDERVAITQASLTDIEVRIIFDDLIAADYVDLELPELAAGLQLLADKQLIAQERVAALMEIV